MNSGFEQPQDRVKAVTNEATTVSESSTVETKLAEVVTEDNSDRQVKVEEFKISGDTLVSKVKELIQQGNARRIIIKNEEGRTLIEIPLTIGVVGGVVGAAMFPVIAAIGAIGAVVAHLTLVVEKKE